MDAHVHFHDCFDEGRFLGAAATNLARAAGPGAAAAGVLLLTESAGVDFFGSLARRPGGQLGDGWRVEPTGEDVSLRLLRADAGLVVVSGRQVVTAERIEVLAVGCGDTPPDGLDLQRTLAEVRRADALPVLPWGFAKWWFGRGRRVAELLEREEPAALFFGDNGGRLRGSPRPRLLERAERRGFRVLPGSDPLPFPAESERAGSRGFLVDAALGPAPAAGLKALLRDPRVRVRPFGAGVRLPEFVRLQLAMQARKRLGGALR